MASFGKPFTTAEVRYFDKSDLQAARAWVEADSDQPSATAS
jgi:SpoIIAA-like